jgi:hypothetical protein
VQRDGGKETDGEDHGEVLELRTTFRLAETAQGEQATTIFPFWRITLADYESPP